MVQVIDRGRPCVLSAPMRFTIEQDGRLAHVNGNPAVFAMAGKHAGRGVVVMPAFWWGNWCGARRGLRGVVRYRGLVQRITFPTLPDCLSATSPASLEAMWG